MSISYVCSSCFEDQDLRTWIRGENGRRGCDACGKFDSPTCHIADLCRYMESCMRKYWGFAVEQLPYETAEGGYQGTTWTTSEILYGDIGLSLPRDSSDRLYYALLRELTDEAWCKYDWLSLDQDVALKMSWKRFCETVKHQRRFFFHAKGTADRDSYTPASLLTAIARGSEYLDLIAEIPEGTKLWRARTDLTSNKKAVAADFGPPPVHLALQSNRMNPPGIPMLRYATIMARRRR